MSGLLVFVILFHPVLAGAAFNPVTTNMAVVALAVIGLHLQRLVVMASQPAAVAG
jgi:hypothetical protein